MFDKINEGRWWDFGWQLVEGCTKVSEGCAHCWSLSKEKRFRKEIGVKFHAERIPRPAERKKPSAYAIWNDLFHESISFEAIHSAYSIMTICSQHIFIILTKRPERAFAFYEYLKKLGVNDKLAIELLKNIWLGVTVENNDQIWRIEKLLQIPAVVRFVSVEPMLGKINIYKSCENICKKCKGSGVVMEVQDGMIGGEWCDCGGMGVEWNFPNWIIAGPETGHGARPMKKEWIESLYNQCKVANVPFFDKKNVLGKNIFELPC